MSRGARPRAIFDRLRQDDDTFSGSLSAVKRLCASIRQEKGVQQEDVAIPVVTEPGDVAQVDFGYAGRVYDPSNGMLRKAWVFVLVLAYSRWMWARIVFDQKTETFIDLHVRAFATLGGVPATLVPDNLKAAVILAAFGHGRDPSLNRSYREMARYYNCVIDPTPPYSPEKKGRAESGVKYVKNNFLIGRDFDDINQSNKDLERWLAEIANARIHGTTQCRPSELLDGEERSDLKPLPQEPYQVSIWKLAKVHRDTHIQVEKAYYSVPWSLLHQQVDVRVTKNSVTIYHGDERVFTHDRMGPGERSTVESHLPDRRSPLRYRSRRHWESHANALGEQAGLLVQRIFDSDDVLSKLRTVQSVVTHLQNFPKERVENTCRRALAYESLTYPAIRDILRKGLDLQPLPQDQRPKSWSQDSRYARSPSDFLPLPRTPDHELD